MMMRQKIGAVMLCLALSAGLHAQNMTSNVTSMYGIGELAANDGGKYAGLGSAGIGLNRQGLVNTQNPACLTRMDTTCFFFDVGLTFAYSHCAMLGKGSRSQSGNLSRVAIAFRPMRRWYVAVGAAPYSSVDYLITEEEYVEGISYGTLSSVFEGDGGLYRLYLSSAVLLGKNLSVGGTIGMISGTIDQTETQESAVVTRSSDKRSFYADLGLHYAINQKWSVGLVYGFQLGLSSDNTQTYENSSTDEDSEKNFRGDKMYIPQRIGGGLTYEGWKWVITGDYSWSKFSKSSSLVGNVKYIDQHKGNLGAIYITNPRRARSTELMAGLGYSNSYIQLKQGKMYNLDVSAGLALPIRETTVSVGVTWRKQLNTRSQLMQEDRIMFNVNVTFGERISRGKIY